MKFLISEKGKHTQTLGNKCFLACGDFQDFNRIFLKSMNFMIENFVKFYFFN